MFKYLKNILNKITKITNKRQKIKSQIIFNNYKMIKLNKIITNKIWIIIRFNF